eukprot:CAMPEP_0179378390 /NCGR_PEP_ID=MMETSP0797-20121207/89309_1 /TAXON_ID=47934 /ORGANISM="Dinophysis acuminata, Strain DAEP01" /LENGTH=235 /DNA_ID=CAMNT_0021094457 /DNA_START=52 /DNA_END=759 /DNA_ORIENTATION=-
MASIADLKSMGAKFWWQADVAKTGRSKCKKCRAQIDAGAARLGWTTDGDDHWGSNWGYFHPACAVLAGRFWKTHSPVDVRSLKGFDSLPRDQQAAVRDAAASPQRGPAAAEAEAPRKRPAGAEDAPAAKRPRKADKAAAGPPAKAVEEMAKLSTDKLKGLLRANDQIVSGTKGVLVARAADGKAFGALPRCPTCHAGRIKFENSIYKCPGYMDDDTFVSCTFTADTVKRNAWKSA